MTDLTDAYENGAYIPGAADYPPRWAAAAADYRAALGERALLGMPYGEGERHRLDLFLPDGDPEGLVVFIHGGYWRRFDRSDWSHFAEGARARGWAVAMPSYDLCPEVHIHDITHQVAQAVTVAAGEIDGPLIVTGHSAGGHLTARMPQVVAPEIRSRILHYMPISPLTDLSPLMLTAMNADLQLDRAEAEAESPCVYHAPEAPVTVWVGGDERPAFLEQARWLEDAWACEVVVDEGRHHFDVIDGLRSPESPMVNRLLNT